ncbi:ATP-grasp domain-containing protein [Streptomyces sp. NPDC049577]|uniref:ATP-grasp domain-containing protein n=1 Tax=Streptomyces sp. NPDC049577 TaxID=3155153 RepID=UPI0034341FC9
MAHLVLVESRLTAGFGLLREAVALGHEVTLVAHSVRPYLRSEGAGADLAHATRVLEGITTGDAEALGAALEALHRDHPVDGVLTLSEPHLRCTAEAAARLGVPYEPPGTSVRLRDKHTVRTLLEKAGVPQPDFRLALTAEEAVAAAGELGYPVVVKPTDGSGKLGVGVAHYPGEVARIAEQTFEARDYGRSIVGAGRVLVERYVPGPVVSCEMLTVDGRHHFYGCTDRVLAPPPYPVELGGCFPAELSPEQLEAVVAVTGAALDAVGVTRSHTHTELVLGPDGPQIIEVNGRLVGGFVPEMMNLVLGHDVYHDAIDLALGGSPVPAPTSGVACIRAVVARESGVLTGIDLEGARSAPGVARVLLDAEPGEHVRPARVNAERLGFLIATGASAAEATAAARAALDRVVLRVTPGEGDPRTAAAASPHEGGV